MNKLLNFLFVTLICVGTVNAQVKTGIVEKSYTDLGKILDYKANIVSSKDLSSSSIENRLILESKSFTSSDSKYIEFTKNQVSEIVKAMNSMNSTYLSTIKTSNMEISYVTENGFEIGSNFEVTIEKATTAAPVTKKEKYYIETKEKYYEGKIVSSDQGGTFIWKDMVVSQAKEKEITGKWIPFIKLYNSTSKSVTTLSVEEFKALLKFFEESLSKM